jgi:hypothetical protein
MPATLPAPPIDLNALMPIRLRDVLQIKGFCERSGIPEGAALAEMLNAKYDLWLAEQELATARRPKPAAAAKVSGAPVDAAEEATKAATAPEPKLNRQQRRQLARAAAKGKVNGAHPAADAATAPSAG